MARETIFDWAVHTLDGASALLSCELPLSIDSKFDSTKGGHILIIIAGFDSDLHAGKGAVPRIASAAAKYDAVGGVEAGPWLMARAGLLNGHTATTHWEDLEDFTNNHPEIDVIPDRYVIDGKYFTTGGASPTFDLMLHLIRSRRGVAFAMEVASAFIYDEAHTPTDAQMLVSLGHLNTFEPRVASAIRIMESRIDEPISINAIAYEMEVSVRMLENLFMAALNISPGKYYRNLRLQVARRLAVDTRLSVQEIAIRTGFNSLSAFSRSYKNRFGVSPTRSRNSG
ncbi:helix-turn-helix domain-containing protein [Candidatus Babeliales bacterium]|nr:helix-turn-helix domain-containing protein [Candidatus Babeliales bacterium]